ncbi:MAG: ATP-binding protein [Gammaproteobacteria bacterium]
MSLRKQLLIISLLTLALPWAGCQYIREMESALRADHESSLADGALAVARVLAESWPDAPTTDPENSELYAHIINAPISLDGYNDDWGNVRSRLRDHASNLGKSDSLHVRALAGLDERYFYLYVTVSDDVVTYLAPNRGSVHDYLVVRWSDPAGVPREQIIETGAPGPVLARDSAADSAAADGLRGVWQPNAAGYQVELRLNRSLLGSTLGFLVVDGDGTPADPPITAGTLTLNSVGAGPLVSRRAHLANTIRDFADAGERLRVADRNGWLLADEGTLTDTNGDAGTQSLLTRIYRWILDPELNERRRTDAAGRVFGPDINTARSGAQSTLWYKQPRQPGAIVAASAPIIVDDALQGTVTLEQQSAAILTLTHSALTRLVNLTVLATATAAIGLLGFATWLSLRIRRLRNAADGALKSDGRIRAAIPGLKASDEIGDLSRSFADLLDQLREYTEYLRSLAGKLSHELRTPLAVVQSSLENLASETMTDSAQVYADRARDGAQRLRRILVSMSEATRVEQSITTAEPEHFDLHALLQGATQGYQDTYRNRRFEYQGTDQATDFLGVPELLLQMLDKLVENAVDFTPENGRIGFALASNEEAYVLRVANEGKTLPPAMQGNLFDSLVSMREGHSEKSHLGLGLFIARLIVQFHNGSIQGHNLADQSGVEFVIELPR